MQNWEEKFFSLQVPEDYKDSCLEKCNLQTKSKIEFGKEWAKKPVPLIMIGGYGTGKTNFAFAIIREMFKYHPNSIWPRYYSSTAFDQKLLEASKSEKGEIEFIDDRKKEDLLFIDDVGRETKSDRLKRQYYEIFNYRHSNKLPTIITSNYDIESISEIIDGALASRLQQWVTLRFNGPDLRAKKVIE